MYQLCCVWGGPTPDARRCKKQPSLTIRNLSAWITVQYTVYFQRWESISPGTSVRAPGWVQHAAGRRARSSSQHAAEPISGVSHLGLNVLCCASLLFERRRTCCILIVLPTSALHPPQHSQQLFHRANDTKSFCFCIRVLTNQRIAHVSLGCADIRNTPTTSRAGKRAILRVQSLNEFIGHTSASVYGWWEHMDCATVDTLLMDSCELRPAPLTT